MKNKILSDNSGRLKKLFSSINPIYGDPDDPDRFLFNVKGIKKAFIPSPMKNIPFIQRLISSASLSKFIRSNFYKENFNSVSHLLSLLKEIRLKYDFFFWISNNSPYPVSYKESASLIRKLQHTRWTGKPVRLIIRKNFNRDISEILSLYILWFKSYSKPGINVMSVSPSIQSAKKKREFFLKWNHVSSSPSLKFRKSNFSCSLHSSDSRLWFISAADPDKCRGRDFSFLLLHDIGEWKYTKETPKERIIPAAFPVVLSSPETVIIMESGPCSRNSFFRKEFISAEKELSPFSPLTIPWYDNSEYILKFDFRDEKLKFFSNLFKYRNRRIFPHYPLMKGKHLYSLWLKGLCLEALHWYASESLYYKSLSSFLSHYPSPVNP